MSGWAVIPTIRVPAMAEALDFYQNRLGFSLEGRGAGADNSSLKRGDARIMIEVPGDLYGAEYNAAIKERIGSASPMALYMEAPDIEDLYGSLTESGTKIVDPLAERPWGQVEFTVEDPYGTWLTFWKETTNKGS